MVGQNTMSWFLSSQANFLPESGSDHSPTPTPHLALSVPDRSSSPDSAELGVWRVGFPQSRAKSFLCYVRVENPYGF